MTNAIFANSGDFVVLYCYSANNTGNTNVYDSALTATLINSSNDQKKGNKVTHSSGTLGAPTDRKMDRK